MIALSAKDGFDPQFADFGPGYRVYYGLDGKTLVILLGGGDKRRQDADINAAVERWVQYKKAKV